MEVLHLRINQLKPNDVIGVLYPIDDEFERLRLSIQKDGVLEPLVVHQVPESNIYEIVSGVRRYNVALSLSIETLPCIVQPYREVFKLGMNVKLRHPISNIQTPKESFPIQSYLEWYERYGRQLMNGDYEPIIVNEDGLLIKGIEILIVASVFLDFKEIRTITQETPNPYLKKLHISMAA